MKNRVLLLLFAVCLSCSLCACGSSESRPAPVPDNPPVYDSEAGSSNELIDVDTIAPVTSIDQSEITQEPVVIPDESPQQSNEPAVPEPATTPSGLILMKATDTNLRDPKIYSVDTETGKSTLIAEYNFAPKTLQDTILYFPGGGFSCGRRELFTSDYQKIAVSMSDSQTGQHCAGWIDASDGSFFNVNEALGQLDRGDFDDVVAYLAVGFTDDGFFVYRQADGGRDDENSYHYVPVDNINPSEVRDGIPFPGYDTSIPFTGYTASAFNKITISDYIGDSRFLINTSDGVSKIFDATTGEKVDYVPGTSRYSWHGVLSPDGGQVAFMSCPKGGLKVDIYTMPLDGNDDPVKIPTDDFRLSFQQNCEAGYDSAVGQATMLVDWR